MRGHPCNDASGPALGVPAEDSGLMSVRSRQEPLEP